MGTIVPDHRPEVTTPRRKYRNPRYAWVYIDPELYRDERFARLPIKERWAYVEGLFLDALAGKARGGPDEWCECAVILRQRRTWPARIRAAIYARDGHACRYCGATERLVLDHIRPLARGGADHESNLQTLCQPCNSRKWAHV